MSHWALYAELLPLVILFQVQVKCQAHGGSACIKRLRPHTVLTVRLPESVCSSFRGNHIRVRIDRIDFKNKSKLIVTSVAIICAGDFQKHERVVILVDACSSLLAGLWNSISNVSVRTPLGLDSVLYKDEDMVYTAAVIPNSISGFIWYWSKKNHI